MTAHQITCAVMIASKYNTTKMMHFDGIGKWMAKSDGAADLVAHPGFSESRLGQLESAGVPVTRYQLSVLWQGLHVEHDMGRAEHQGVH